MRVAPVGLCALVVVLAGCGGDVATSGATPTVSISPTTSVSPSSAPGPGDTDPTDPVSLPTAATGAPVTLTGIPQQGTEPGCLLLDRYLLVGGDRELLASGVEVRVTGRTARGLMSFCQQGIYLVVESVTKAAG